MSDIGFHVDLRLVLMLIWDLVLILYDDFGFPFGFRFEIYFDFGVDFDFNVFWFCFRFGF